MLHVEQAAANCFIEASEHTFCHLVQRLEDALFIRSLYIIVHSLDTSSRLRRACIRVRVAAAASWSSAASSWRICRTAAACVMSLTWRQPPSSPVPSSSAAVACCLAASAACENCHQHTRSHVVGWTSDHCMWHQLHALCITASRCNANSCEPITYLCLVCNGGRAGHDGCGEPRQARHVHAIALGAGACSEVALTPLTYGCAGKVVRRPTGVPGSMLYKQPIAKAHPRPADIRR